MKLTIGLLRYIIKEHLLIREWAEPAVTGYFHITPRSHLKSQEVPDTIKKTIILKPQIPRTALEHVTDAEDFTTPRVCLANSVHGCVFGRFGENYDSHLPQDEMLVYIATNVDVFVPKSTFTLEWSWYDYAEEHNIDPSDKEIWASVVRNNVPDAKETGEVWSLKPVKATYIGKIYEKEWGSGVESVWI